MVPDLATSIVDIQAAVIPPTQFIVLASLDANRGFHVLFSEHGQTSNSLASLAALRASRRSNSSIIRSRRILAICRRSRARIRSL